MIYLTKENFQDIIGHCQKEYPKEACGILAGREGKVSKVYKMVNISDSPETCYFMKPEEQLKVFKEMRNLGMEMLAIYHSHSKSSAYPSQRDCEMAFYPEASYVIGSLQNFNNPEIHAFKIVESKIEEEKIVVRKNILFVCVKNSCRSQIAEAIVNNLYWQKFVAFSAGSKPLGMIDPLAIEVMKEIGIDISNQKSKGFESIKDIEFDYIITMGCGDECPTFLQRSVHNVQRISWDMPDSEDKPIEFFREVRDEIERKIKELV